MIIKNIRRNDLPKFEQGEKVILDKEFSNSSEVIVKYQSPLRLFTAISVDGSEEWQVMTMRLSKINKKL